MQKSCGHLLSFVFYRPLQIQKDSTGCDIDRATLSDHTQDYKIVLARKEVQ